MTMSGRDIKVKHRPTGSQCIDHGQMRCNRWQLLHVFRSEMPRVLQFALELVLNVGELPAVDFGEIPRGR